MIRPLSALAFAIAAGAYFALFALDHVESFQTSPILYWMMLTPFVVEQLEVRTGAYELGGGLDNLGTSILAFYALPAAALAAFAVFVVRRLA